MSPAYTPRHAPVSRFLAVRGLRHHLMTWHDGAAGPPLVMLHGWMDVGASFQFVVDALDAGRRVIAPDWRGFGRSDCSGADAYWFPDYLADLDALSPDQPVDLLGHSMGGNIAMSYAGVRPQRIRKLVNLEGFGLPQTQPQQAPDRLAQWLDELKTPARLKPYASLDAVAQRLRQNNPRLAAERAAWLAPHWSEPDGAGGWRLLADPAHKRVNPVLYRKEEVLATWQRIAAPVLWVEGDASDMRAWWGDRYPRADFEARIAQVPRLQRAVLAQAGHMLHHDQPDALAQHMARFLAEPA